MNDKPVLVGEVNPYSSDPSMALYVTPRSRSGYRMCRVILGVSVADYLSSFDRVNLCDGRWDATAAREKASELLATRSRVVALGRKAGAALGVGRLRIFQQSGSVLLLPHPSSRCRVWNRSDSVARARAALARFAPELSRLVGVT